MTRKNRADYMIGPDATIEDANLDEIEVYYQGERLTEARAAELGEQAAQDAREAREANLIPGRKSLSGGHKHSPVLNVRLPEEYFELLLTYAKAHQTSRSAVARDVLIAWLKSLAEVGPRTTGRPRSGPATKRRPRTRG